jgi:uncharacterized membrane protein
VELLAELERRSVGHESPGERAAGAIVKVVGTPTCALLHGLLIASWAVVNVGLVAGIEPFDPFPFGILTLFVSAEGVLLAIFILISQNRMSRADEQRSRLGIHISTLAERETTKILQLLRELHVHAGLGSEPDPDAEVLQRETSLEDLAHQIDDRRS